MDRTKKIDKKERLFLLNYMCVRGDASGKEPTCQCRRRKRQVFDPWVRKIPGEGNGNLPQYSYLENLMDRGAWRAIVQRVSKNQAQVKRLSKHACTRERDREKDTEISIQTTSQTKSTLFLRRLSQGVSRDS